MRYDPRVDQADPQVWDDTTLPTDLSGSTDSEGRRIGEWRSPPSAAGETLHVPFESGRAHGVVTWRSGDGRTIRDATFVEGVAHGPFRIHHPGGGVAEEHPYEHGLEHGTRRAFDPSGRLVATVEMVGGLPHGAESTFDPDGRLAAVQTWRRGRLHGAAKWFDENGATVMERRHYEGEFHGTQQGVLWKADWCHGAMIRAPFVWVGDGGETTRAPVLRILMAALAWALLAWRSPGLAATLASIGAAIAIHEWGHASAARRAGIPIATMRIGFGPLVARFTWGSRLTEIRAIPLFGFVAPAVVRPSALPHIRAAMRGVPGPPDSAVRADETPVPASTVSRPLPRLAYELGGVAANFATALVVRWLTHDPADPLGALAWAGRTAVRMLSVVPAMFASLFDPSSWVPAEGGLLAAGDQDVTGVASALRMFMIVSMILASFNLAPVPPLDGFKALVSGVEAARGRPVPEKALRPFHWIGYAVFGLLALSGLWHMGRDIVNVLGK